MSDRQLGKVAPVTFDGGVPPPNFVSIETTKFCNLSCDMCLQFQDGTTVTGPHMPLEDFEVWADQILPFVTTFQPSVTGEPLLSVGFPRMLEKAAEHGVQLEVTCNGTLLNERMRAKLMPVLSSITISFDGGTKEVFEETRAGANFENVRDRVRALCEEVAALPEGRRPIICLGVVLRMANIRDVVSLVDLASDMGVDLVWFTHMYPPTEELKSESLVHDIELAIDYIDRALKRAEELGLELHVAPMDQLRAASATSGGERRKYSTVDGVVEGLEGKSACGGQCHLPPEPLPSDHSDHEAITRRREQAWSTSEFLRPVEEARGKELPDSIWFCDYLWNKTYVGVEGDVTPCCVPGVPYFGSLRETPFEDIWNSLDYRNMRLRMAMGMPVAVCRGCQHISETTDKDEIHRALQGLPLPDQRTVIAERLGGAPEFHWEKARNTLGYEIEFSLDGFASIAFSSSWQGELLETNSYRVPDWAWEMASQGQQVYWRAQAHLEPAAGSSPTRFVVGHGMTEIV